jgi:hypothetical protein
MAKQRRCLHWPVEVVGHTNSCETSAVALLTRDDISYKGGNVYNNLLPSKATISAGSSCLSPDDEKKLVQIERISCNYGHHLGLRDE